MNDYCLYPALCGPGMDCTKCYEQYVPNLQAENERLQVQIKDLHDACEPIVTGKHKAGYKQ